MATQLFLIATAAPDLSADEDLLLSTTRLVGVSTRSASTVAGPTAGVQVANSPTSWWYRVNAVTISGTITPNFWMSESNMSANVGAQVIIDRCNSTGTFISTVLNSEKGTELPVTTRDAQNWAPTPTSTDFNDGDYIRVRIYGNDVGAGMASGHTFTLGFGGGSGSADDSYVTFTETITEYSARIPRSRKISQAVKRSASY